LASPYTLQDAEEAIKLTKSGKAAGQDDTYPEFLKNFVHKGEAWCASFFTDIHPSGTIPLRWREIKAIATHNPGKLLNDSSSF